MQVITLITRGEWDRSESIKLCLKSLNYPFWINFFLKNKTKTKKSEKIALFHSYFVVVENQILVFCLQKFSSFVYFRMKNYFLLIFWLKNFCKNFLIINYKFRHFQKKFWILIPSKIFFSKRNYFLRVY